jgi:hypothetical protein
MWLDAQGHSECACVNEKARGGQILPVGFAGDEADGGDGGRCRRRGYRVPAVEFDALADAPESGEAVSLVGEERGGEGLPELAWEVVGAAAV